MYRGDDDFDDAVFLFLQDPLQHHGSIGHNEEVAEEGEDYADDGGYFAGGGVEVACLIPLIRGYVQLDLALFDRLL